MALSFSKCHLISSVVIAACNPTGTTALFSVGLKAKAGVVTPNLTVRRLSEWEKTQIWMHGLYVIKFCGKFTFFLSIWQVWGSSPPFLWRIGWKPVCELSEIAEERMPWPLMHACLQHCCPVRLPLPGCMPCSLSSCQFAHKEFLR